MPMLMSLWLSWLLQLRNIEHTISTTGLDHPWVRICHCCHVFLLGPMWYPSHAIVSCIAFSRSALNANTFIYQYTIYHSYTMSTNFRFWIPFFKCISESLYVSTAPRLHTFHPLQADLILHVLSPFVQHLFPILVTKHWFQHLLNLNNPLRVLLL